MFFSHLKLIAMLILTSMNEVTASTTLTPPTATSTNSYTSKDADSKVEVQTNFPILSSTSAADMSSKLTGKPQQKRLNLETMSQSLRHMDYAVRGKVVAAADRIADELQQHQQSPDHHQYPFDHIVYTNIGNPHSLGQAPLTWPRQVMALVDLPDHVGVHHPEIATLFPKSAIRRAKSLRRRSFGEYADISRKPRS